MNFMHAYCIQQQPQHLLQRSSTAHLWAAACMASSRPARRADLDYAALCLKRQASAAGHHRQPHSPMRRSDLIVNLVVP